MKKYFLFVILTISLLMSCTKNVPEPIVQKVTVADVVLSPVIGLNTVKLNGNNPVIVIGSYRVKNYSNSPMKVYGLQIEVFDQMFATSHFWYSISSAYQTQLTSIGWPSYINFDIQTLLPGDETRNYNLWTQCQFPQAFFNYSYSGSSAVVEVKVVKILTSLGEFNPQANTLISFNVIP